MASIQSQNNESPDTGTNIMIAGLAWQVFTLLGFILVSLDFALRLRKYGTSSSSKEIQHGSSFNMFLAALGISTFLILWRSIFRCAELSDGWEGSIISDQELFIAFEGIVIAVAVALLVLCHPSFCAKDLFYSELAGSSKQRKEDQILLTSS